MLPSSLNIMQSYVSSLVPQYYNTVGTGLKYIVTPTQFKSGSTSVYINSVYQPFASYTEGSDNQTLGAGQHSRRIRETNRHCKATVQTPSRRTQSNSPPELLSDPRKHDQCSLPRQ